MVPIGGTVGLRAAVGVSGDGGNVASTVPVPSGRVVPMADPTPWVGDGVATGSPPSVSVQPKVVAMMAMTAIFAIGRRPKYAFFINAHLFYIRV